MHGIKRRASSFNTTRIDHPYQDPHELGEQGQPPQLKLHYGDLSDGSNLQRIVEQVQPDEIYNLGAQSHVAVSFEAPEYTANVDALGTLRILKQYVFAASTKKTRIYQASYFRALRSGAESPQQETTPFHPRSPYGVAKLYAYWITVNYREAYDMYACNGLLFNHESRDRGETFVTRRLHVALQGLMQASRIVYLWGILTQTRLGPCTRLCGNAMANVATGETRRFCNRNRPPGNSSQISSSSLPALWDGENCKGRRRATGSWSPQRKWKNSSEDRPAIFPSGRSTDTFWETQVGLEKKLGWTPAQLLEESW